MASGLNRVRLEAAHLGIDLDSAPSRVAPGKALVLQNYLTGEDGRTKIRGAIRGSAIAHGAIERAIGGIFKGNDKLLAGYYDLKGNDSGTPRDIERHVAPRTGSAGSKLASAYDAANNMRLLDLRTDTVQNVTNTDAAARAASTPYFRGTRVGRFVYGFGLDTANDIVTPDANFTIGQNDSGGYERLTYMLRWNLTDPTTAPVGYICGPYGGQDMRFYYNKLFALGGRQPETGGGFIESNVVWYTREWVANHHNYGFSPLYDGQNVTPAGTLLGGAWTGSPPSPLVGAAGDCNQGASSPSAMWFSAEDPGGTPTAATPGTPLRLDLPGDEQDFGVAFAFVGRNLGILKRRSVVVLVGGDPDTWQLRTAVQGVGCLDPRSIVEANEGAYFASQQGFMYFDGVQMHNASRGVEGSLLEAIHQAVGDEGEAGGFVVSERLDRDFIFVTVGRYYYSTNGSADPQTPDVYFAGLYHIPSNSWSTFTTGLFSSTDGGPQWIERSENRLGVIGHLNAYTGQYITQPERIAESSRAIDTSNNTVETKWHSRIVELAMPFETAVIKRVIVDYEWIKNDAAVADTDPSTTGPTVTICDGAGTALGGDSTFKLPFGVDSGAEVLRQRHAQDCYVECSEVQVRIEYTDPGTDVALVQSSILDVWIEYQVSHENHRPT